MNTKREFNYLDPALLHTKLYDHFFTSFQQRTRETVKPKAQSQQSLETQVDF